MKRISVVLVVVLSLSILGCQTTPDDTATLMGAAVGTGVGMVLGNNLGNSRNDMALAGVAGGLTGAAIGKTYGQQSQTKAQLQQLQIQQSQTTIWVSNKNGSKTPVTITQSAGGQYIGPRGEFYPSLPSEQQLQAMYGM